MAGNLCLPFLSLPLATTGDLCAAVIDLGLLSRPPFVAEPDLAEALVLRAAAAACAGAAADGATLPLRAVETLNSFAGDEPPAIALRPDGTLVRGAPAPVRAALAAIARDTIETVVLERIALRRCAACDTPFLDRSRGGRRRWCSMQRCGNRAKASAFRSRRTG